MARRLSGSPVSRAAMAGAASKPATVERTERHHGDAEDGAHALVVVDGRAARRTAAREPR